MCRRRIGEVTHFFSGISVAVVNLNSPLHIGDSISILGKNTDLEQKVTSMQVDHADVEQGHPGQEVAIKVTDRVREGDVLYLLTE